MYQVFIAKYPELQLLSSKFTSFEKKLLKSSSLILSPNKQNLKSIIEDESDPMTQSQTMPSKKGKLKIKENSSMKEICP